MANNNIISLPPLPRVSNVNFQAGITNIPANSNIPPAAPAPVATPSATTSTPANSSYTPPRPARTRGNRTASLGRKLTRFTTGALYGFDSPISQRYAGAGASKSTRLLQAEGGKELERVQAAQSASVLEGISETLLRIEASLSSLANIMTASRSASGGTTDTPTGGGIGIPNVLGGLGSAAASGLRAAAGGVASLATSAVALPALAAAGTIGTAAIVANSWRNWNNLTDEQRAQIRAQDREAATAAPSTIGAEPENDREREVQVAQRAQEEQRTAAAGTQTVVDPERRRLMEAVAQQRARVERLSPNSTLRRAAENGLAAATKALNEYNAKNPERAPQQAPSGADDSLDNIAGRLTATQRNRQAADRELDEFTERYGTPDTTRTVAPEPGSNVDFSPYQVAAYSDPERQRQYEALNNRSADLERDETRLQRQAQAAVVGAGETRNSLQLDGSGAENSFSPRQIVNMFEALRTRFRVSEETLQRFEAPADSRNFILDATTNKKYLPSIITMFRQLLSADLERRGRSRDDATDRVGPEPVQNMERPPAADDKAVAERVSGTSASTAVSQAERVAQALRQTTGESPLRDSAGNITAESRAQALANSAPGPNVVAIPVPAGGGGDAGVAQQAEAPAPSNNGRRVARSPRTTPPSHPPRPADFISPAR